LFREVSFMPLYEYQCKSCGSTIEVIQKFSDRALRKCSGCSGPLQKLVSRSSFHLKGGGWYTNDYSTSKSASPKSESPSTESKTKKPCDAGSSGGGCASGNCSS
jgi:putative FmdB family regulatory protein